MKLSNLFSTILAFALFTVRAVAVTHYVSPSSPTPTPPYTSWATAAVTIQDAIDAAATGDLVLVTNGTYNTGGRVIYGPNTNRVALSTPITVSSVNGPAVTVIEGYQIPGNVTGATAVRCAYLTNGATLAGFTLTNGATHSSADGTFGSGGGVWSESPAGVVSNCIIVGNAAAGFGGGAWNTTLINCALSGNTALTGGAACYGSLMNCTVTGNSALTAGGTAYCSANNSVLYYNPGGNSSYGVFNYCCITPLPPAGANNIAVEPGLADAFHLSPSSPCREAGYGTASGADIDGDPWANPPSIGCDEYVAGSITGPLAVTLQADTTNVAAGITVSFTATVSGRAVSNRWDFGDGALKANSPFSETHTWTSPGDYVVQFRAYNEGFPAGVAATVTVHVVAIPVEYVSISNTNPVPPYSSWLTAATNIQDAIDIALPGSLILVSNGVYSTGGRRVNGSTTNRVAVTKQLTIRSINGPASTVIQGYSIPGSGIGAGTVRCVFLTNDAVLSGFTMTGGGTEQPFDPLGGGGGVLALSTSAIVTNCIITGNTAGSGGGTYRPTVYHSIISSNSAQYGAGCSGGTLNNCLIVSNQTRYYVFDGQYAQAGAGASGSTLINCTVCGNSVTDPYGAGGGVDFCTTTNCNIYYNSAATGPNLSNPRPSFPTPMTYCCTTPSREGVGNITNAPLFADPLAGNFRLLLGSPCINAGTNVFAPSSPDLDGRPRIYSGTIDIGAYEFINNDISLFDGWLQQFSLPTDGSADFTDPDSDGHNNWQEWLAGTIPTNAASVLRMAALAVNTTNTTLTWASVTNRSYFVQRSTNLTISAFQTIATNIPGSVGTTLYSDINPPAGPAFYRVGTHP